MILTITRAQLVAANACASGLDAWDRVSDACGVSRDAWTLDWTSEAQVLALACPEWRRHFGWLVRAGIVPMRSMAKANLAGAELADAYFANASLAGADLTGADLRGANLRGANLRGANLTGADLAGAFRYADDPQIPGWRRGADGWLVRA